MTIYLSNFSNRNLMKYIIFLCLIFRMRKKKLIVQRPGADVGRYTQIKTGHFRSSTPMPGRLDTSIDIICNTVKP